MLPDRHPERLPGFPGILHPPGGVWGDPRRQESSPIKPFYKKIEQIYPIFRDLREVWPVFPVIFVERSLLILLRADVAELKSNGGV